MGSSDLFFVSIFFFNEREKEREGGRGSHDVRPRSRSTRGRKDYFLFLLVSKKKFEMSE